MNQLILPNHIDESLYHQHRYDRVKDKATESSAVTANICFTSIVQNWNIVEDGGWHFSFVMNSSKIREKIRSFAHAEFNKSEYIKVKSIKKNIALKKDLFDRKLNFIKIEDERKLPKYLLRNKHKYEELFI